MLYSEEPKRDRVLIISAPDITLIPKYVSKAQLKRLLGTIILVLAMVDTGWLCPSTEIHFPGLLSSQEFHGEAKQCRWLHAAPLKAECPQR